MLYNYTITNNNMLRNLQLSPFKSSVAYLNMLNYNQNFYTPKDNEKKTKNKKNIKKSQNIAIKDKMLCKRKKFTISNRNNEYNSIS